MLKHFVNEFPIERISWNVLDSRIFKSRLLMVFIFTIFEMVVFMLFVCFFVSFHVVLDKRNEELTFCHVCRMTIITGLYHLY